MSLADTPDNAAAESDVNVFALELRRWRDVRGLSRRALASRLGYSRPYVSKIESGAEKPSRDFAACAESTLQAGGALRRAFAEFAAGRPAPVRTSLPESHDSTGALVVDHDEASLSFDGNTYRLSQRRRLINGGCEPITRYLIRISVDRYPGDPERSNQLYQENPLTWEEINLHAWHGHDRGESMAWEVHHDRDAFKEVWLLFTEADGRRRFPLYPGDACWIEYEYTISATHWGNWFQRAVRLPTNRLLVHLEFPTALEPSVWGLQTSMTAEGQPFSTPITHQLTDRRHHYSWSTDHPPLHARYRLEWDFRGRSDHERVPPSKVMAGLGIVQEGDDILRQTARRFELPAEADEAKRVVADLEAAAARVAQAHVFGKGMGIAAPQIGISRAAAIVHTPDGDTIALFNPSVVETGGGEDDQYEGCLSFFDLRGRVPRPLTIHVEHTDLEGNTRITVFERGVARLVVHEVEHLHGQLYLDHMRPGVEPIPVEQYRSTGQNWLY